MDGAAHRPEEPDRGAGDARRPLLVLLLVSLGVRLAAWAWVAWSDVPPLFDEGTYLRRADALAAVLRELATFSSPTPEQWSAAYDGGIWPPLHSLLMVPGLLVAGEGSAAAARLPLVLLAVATTFLAWRVTTRLAGPRAGLLAGWVHALHPAFVAYSHLLWAEAAFAFFLLGALDASLRAGGERWVRPTLLAGALLGLAGLTRAASLPYLVLFPAWTFLRRDLARPRLAAGALGAVALLLVAPWLGVLAAQEGRFVLMTTEGGWNLYLGNNPWTDDGTGSSWASAEEKQLMGQARAALVQREGIDRDAAASRLALEELRSHPGRLPLRLLRRLRTFWMLDSFLGRHVLHVAYPPLPVVLVVLGFLVLFVVHVALVGLAAFGFLARPPLGHRTWLLVLLVLGTAPAILTLGIPRLAHPAQVLLLPAVGHGLARLRTERGRGPVLAGLAAAGLLVLGIATGLGSVARGHLMPSAAYEPIVRRLESFGDVSIVRIDELHLRLRGHRGERLEVLLPDAERWFHASAREPERYPRRFVGTLDQGAWTGVLTVLGRASAEPLVLELAVGDRRVRVEPLAAPVRGQWRPTGIEGVELAWMGGGRLPTYE